MCCWVYPVRLQLPLLSTDADDGAFSQGIASGLDLGASWERDDLFFGLTVRNVFNTFEWDLDRMVFRPGTALFDQEGSESDFDTRPASEAPNRLREGALALEFVPMVALGVGYRIDPDLRLVADVAGQLGEGMDPGTDFRLGLGADLMAFHDLPVRAHVSVLDTGIQVGGGVEVPLGAVRLNLSGAWRGGSPNDAVSGMVAVSWGGT